MVITREELVTAIEVGIESAERWEQQNADDDVMHPASVEAQKMTARELVQDPAHLDRILVARKYKKQPSVDLFWEQVKFRTRYQPGSIEPKAIPTALPSGAWRLTGTTKDGHVLSNYRLEHWNPDDYGDDLSESVAEYTRYVCYMMELMIAASTEHAKFSVLFDLNGFYVSMVARSNIRAMIKRLIYVAQAQYPERLQQVYLVHAPYGFATAWKLISALLDAKTADKIQFVSSDEMLLEDIDKGALTEQYGGTHEEYPVPSLTIDDEVTLWKKNVQ